MRNILLLSVLSTYLITCHGFKPPDNQSLELVIEDLRKNMVLWKIDVRDGDELDYSYIHSIYGDRVYERYRVDSNAGFVLIRVTSTPLVLFSTYPGYELNHDSKQKSAYLQSVKLKRIQKTLTIAVGGEITDNRLTVGERTISFTHNMNQGGVVKIFLSR